MSRRDEGCYSEPGCPRPDAFVSLAPLATSAAGWPPSSAASVILARRTGAAREAARRLGLVTLAQMLQSLVCAVEHPATALRVLEVPDIRRGALQAT